MNCPNCNTLMESIGPGADDCWQCGKRVDTFHCDINGPAQTRQYVVVTVIGAANEITQDEAVVMMLGYAIRDGHTGDWLILEPVTSYDLMLNAHKIGYGILINKQIDHTGEVMG